MLYSFEFNDKQMNNNQKKYLPLYPYIGCVMY